jgi:hypothetical protein
MNSRSWVFQQRRFFVFHLEPAEDEKDKNRGLPLLKPPAYDSHGKPLVIPLPGLFVVVFVVF